MSNLAKPDYIKNLESGEVEEIFCKVCGTKIAGQVNELVNTYKAANGNTVEERNRRFRRFPTYTEMKIEFEDGSFHVTNGCAKCLQLNMNKHVLQAMYEADLDELKLDFKFPDRKAKRAVVVSSSQKGIV